VHVLCKTLCVCVHPVNTICTFVSVQEFPGKRATTVTIVHNFETAIDTSTSHNWLGLHAVTVLQFVRFLFSALTLFVGQRQIRNLACKKFALVNPRVSLLTDTAQLRVTVGKRPNVNKSNVCVCVCVCVCPAVYTSLLVVHSQEPLVQLSAVIVSVNTT